MKELKFALLGCGQIARKHAGLLGKNMVQGARLVAVCDKDEKKASGFAVQYGIIHYQDINKMMEDQDVDVVCVLTPSGLHAEHVTALAEYRKHIIVEKPMALKLKDAILMHDICEQNGIRLFVVKQNRFNLPVLKLKEALDLGRFGKLVLGTVRVRWSRPQEYYASDSWRGTFAYDGGVLANQADHHIDLLNWFMGEVESVYAKGITALANIESEDTAAVILKFKSGALGVIEATTATRPKDLEGSISILGEKGSVEIGGFAMNELKTWNFTEECPEDKNIQAFAKNPEDTFAYPHHSFYDHVIKCLHNPGLPAIDGLEGKKGVKLISAIYESLESGKEVFVDQSQGESRLGRK